MKNIVNYLLIVLFFIVYLKIIQFFVWRHLPIHSSFGVLVGTLFVLIITVVLAIVTVNKIAEIIRT